MVETLVDKVNGRTLSLNTNPLEEARVAHEKYLLTGANENLVDAVNKYVATVKESPEVCESYYRLASLMLESGEIDINGAIQQCQTAISKSPKNLNARLYAAYFMDLASEFAEAEKEYKEAIKIGGLKSARARILFATSLLNKIKESKFNVIDSTKFVYNLVTGLLLLSFDKSSLNMLYKNVKDSVCVSTYKLLGNTFETLNILEPTLKLYDKATSKTGHIALFYSKMGDLLMRKEQYNTALDCYKKVYDSEPSNRDNLLKLATITRTYLPENYDEAIDYYNALLKFEKDTEQIYYELGHIYMKKGDNFHALVAFKLALDSNENNPYYNNAIAFAYLRSNMVEDAIEHYQKAISLNPDDKWTSLVCHTLGLVYLDTRMDFVSAIAAFQAGLVLDENNYDLQIALADAYLMQDDTHRAIKTFCDAIRVNPNFYIAYAKMGLALWNDNKVDESIVAYSKALELNPNCDIVHNNLGVVYLEALKDYAQAEQCFMRAIELNPSYTLAYFNAGKTYQAMGEINDAASYYQMALDLNRISPEMVEEDIQEKIYELFNL